MRVAVVGPGALGSLFAAAFAEAGAAVTLVDHDPVRAADRAARPLALRGTDGHLRQVTLAVVGPGSTPAPPPELVCLFVKAQHTGAALAMHADLFGAADIALTLQNGLGNAEAVAALVGREHTVAGVTAEGAHFHDAHTLTHAGRGETAVAPLVPAGRARAERVAALLAAAGFAVRTVDDIRPLLWTKLAINAGLNALTALLRVPNGVPPRVPAAAGLLDAAIAETVAVADRLGIPLDVATLRRRARDVAAATAANRSSMLCDVLAGRSTEVGHINGAIAAEARRLGLPCPVNAVLAALVEALEGSAAERVAPAAPAA